MDYKYIEQLVERYFQCETSLEEEQILRTFFSQKDVPAALEPYRSLFVYEQSEPKEDRLGEDFDQRILALIEEDQPKVKARVITMEQRFRPLLRAAAVVGVILTIGLAAQMPYGKKNDVDAEKFAAMHSKDSADALQPAVAMRDSGTVNLGVGHVGVPVPSEEISVE